MSLLMDLVRIENEDNAVLCMKTIMDFQRNYQKTLLDQVQPFLNLIQDMFSKMPQAVKDTFDNPSSGATPAVPATVSGTLLSSMSAIVPPFPLCRYVSLLTLCSQRTLIHPNQALQ